MKVLVYGLNFRPEMTGIGKYTGEFCQYLAGADSLDVRVITAPPYYPKWKIYPEYKNRYQVEKATHLSIYRCPLYVPESPSKLTRLLHLASFAISSIPIMLHCLFWKPDKVIVVAPSLFCAPMGLLVAKVSSATAFLHIQDFELDAMISIIGDDRSSSILKIAIRIERWLLCSFNYVSTISQSMKHKLCEKGVKPTNIFLFRNWVNTNYYKPAPREAELLSDMGINASAFVVLYAGNMGEKQGLDTVIEAAKKLQFKKEIVFLLVGDGAKKAQLMAKVVNESLNSIVFADLVAEEVFPRLLATVDLHLIVQKKGTADLVMPSKLTSVLSVGGTAIVTSEKGSELENLSQERPGIFIYTEPEDSTLLAEAILQAWKNHDEQQPESIGASCNNPIARQYAVDELDSEYVLSEFVIDLNRK